MSSEVATREVDREIADMLEQLFETVSRQAEAEQQDARRGGILQSLRSLLEQPRRAATMLAAVHDG